MAGLTELVQIMVTPETDEMLKEWAKSDGQRTVSSVIRSLIEAERVRRTRQLELTLSQSVNHSDLTTRPLPGLSWLSEVSPQDDNQN